MLPELLRREPQEPGERDDRNAGDREDDDPGSEGDGQDPTRGDEQSQEERPGVAPRHLANEARVTVLLARSPDQFATKEAETNFERLRDVQILAGLDKSEDAIAGADLLIDALLGIGAEGTIREPYGALILQMNASGKPILSIDVPSGIGTERSVKPTATV